MPGYKTHLLGGLVTFALGYSLATIYFTMQPSLYDTFVLCGVTLLGSLIPDLDVSSKIQRLFYFITFGAFIGFLFTHQIILLCITAALALVVAFIRHRTIFHHPVFLALLPLPVIYYMSNNNVHLSTTITPTLFFIAGTWSHLLLDFGLKGRPQKR